MVLIFFGPVSRILGCRYVLGLAIRSAPAETQGVASLQYLGCRPPRHIAQANLLDQQSFGDLTLTRSQF